MTSATLKQWIRSVLMMLALVLVAGALMVVGSSADWAVLARVSPWVWIVFAGLVAVNLALAGLMFWVVTLSFDATPRVEPGRMLMLVAGSALLNYLPLRPGLIGRAAVLRTHHHLPVKQSALILLVVLVTGTAVTVLVGLLALVIVNPWLLLGCIVVVSVVMSMLTGPIASRVLRRPVVMAWLWVPIRMVDALVASARLWLAFAVMGEVLNLRESLVAGAAGLFTAMLGITPNGLGVKEWVIALLADAMQVSTVQTGLAASLVDRGIEAVVISVLGLTAIFALRKWVLTGRQRLQDHDDTSTSDPE